jgi:peptidyl-prolyl cis-trans isomerase C
MTKTIAKCILSAFLINFSGLSISEEESSSREVLAEINGELISKEDLDKRLAKLASDIQSRYASKEGKELFLKEIIRIRIFASEAKALGLDQDPDVKSRIDDVVDAMLSHQYIKRKIIDTIEISDQEIKDYYQENHSQFYRPEQLNAPSVLIPIPSNSSNEQKSEVNNLATEITQKLRQGIEFASLKDTYPNTTSFQSDGFFPPDRLTPEVAELVLQLNPGEVSNPIQVDNGLIIFVLKEKLPKQELALDQVSNDIKSRLFDAKRNKAFKNQEDYLFEKYNAVIRNNKPIPDE